MPELSLLRQLLLGSGLIYMSFPQTSSTGRLQFTEHKALGWFLSPTFPRGSSVDGPGFIYSMQIILSEEQAFNKFTNLLTCPSFQHWNNSVSSQMPRGVLTSSEVETGSSRGPQSLTPTFSLQTAGTSGFKHPGWHPCSTPWSILRACGSAEPSGQGPVQAPGL